MCEKSSHMLGLKNTPHKNTIMKIFSNIAKELREIGRTPGDSIDLGRTALLLAQTAQPHSKIAPYLRHFEKLKKDVADYANGACDLSSQHEALVQVIYKRFGYTGTLRSFDTLEAANLMRVIDCRNGLPVALGIIYISVAQKLGWSACGLNFPARFLIRLKANSEQRILDPFESGKKIGPKGLRRLLKSLVGEMVELKPSYFSPVSPRSILLRLEENRRIRFVASQRWEEAEKVVENMIMIAPTNANLWRAKASLQKRQGYIYAAIESLEESLKYCSEDNSRYATSAMIQDLRQSLF